MSKIAVISDIHGDLDALQRALAIIEQERCQKIICLGDVLDSRAENEKILELLKEHRAICVRGNHEDLEHVDHTPTVKVYLDSCLEELTLTGFHSFHVIKRVPEHSLKTKYEAWNIFDEFPWRFSFIGHNHRPVLYVHDEHTIGECPEIVPVPGVTLKVRQGTRCIAGDGTAINI